MEDKNVKTELVDNVPPAAVIFDMDGVLVDTEPMHARCYVDIFKGYGLECTVAHYRQQVILGHKDVRDVYVSIGGDMEKWPEVMAAKSVKMMEQITSDWSPMPGVLELLRELELARVPAALVTSAGTRTMGILLDRFDLRKYFSEFVTWQDVKATKPDPEGFLIAAERLGVIPANCVVIEDSPRGVMAANRAGMKCVAVPNGYTIDGDLSLATVVVESLEEVTLGRMRGLFRCNWKPESG